VGTGVCARVLETPNLVAQIGEVLLDVAPVLFEPLQPVVLEVPVAEPIPVAVAMAVARSSSKTRVHLPAVPAVAMASHHFVLSS
jgi:hypothetical protein